MYIKVIPLHASCNVNDFYCFQSLKMISKRNRDEIINSDLKNKRKKEEYKEKSDAVLRFIKEFD